MFTVKVVRKWKSPPENFVLDSASGVCTQVTRLRLSWRYQPGHTGWLLKPGYTSEQAGMAWGALGSPALTMQEEPAGRAPTVNVWSTRQDLKKWQPLSCDHESSSGCHRTMESATPALKQKQCLLSFLQTLYSFWPVCSEKGLLRL